MTLEGQIRDIFTKPINEWSEDDFSTLRDGSNYYGHRILHLIMADVIGDK